MAKKILEMVIEKRDRMQENPEEAEQNAAMAIEAINGGVRSTAWRDYMLQFVEKDDEGTPLDPLQLERLLATDGTLGYAEMDRHRAYIVGNAICGAASPGGGGNLAFGVESIDENLPAGCQDAMAQ